MLSIEIRSTTELTRGVPLSSSTFCALLAAATTARLIWPLPFLKVCASSTTSSLPRVSAGRFRNACGVISVHRDWRARVLAKSSLTWRCMEAAPTYTMPSIMPASSSASPAAMLEMVFPLPTWKYSSRPLLSGTSMRRTTRIWWSCSFTAPGKAVLKQPVVSVLWESLGLTTMRMPSVTSSRRGLTTTAVELRCKTRAATLHSRSLDSRPTGRPCALKALASSLRFHAGGLSFLEKRLVQTRTPNTERSGLWLFRRRGAGTWRSKYSSTTLLMLGRKKRSF